MKLTCYGGVGQIGGNQFLLEDGEVRIFFDFGIPFHERGRFYEEYLKPRPGFGLLDPLTMGLLPPLRGLYRADLEQAVPDLWDNIQGSAGFRDLQDVQIHGVLLSHAHLDHTGYLSFVREDVPVYTSAMTAFIAKAIQDSGRSDFESEVVYTIPKQRIGALIQAERRIPAQQRLFRVFEHSSLSPEAHAFWVETPGSRALTSIDLQPATDIAGLEVRCFSVDHSIPGASAFAVRTSAGWVAYSGDIRLHGTKGQLSHHFAEELRALKPLALLCEGTRADLEREGDPNYTEQDVLERALDEVHQARGLVAADFGPRNIERLRIFAQIARETGRALVVLPKDAYLLKTAHLIDPAIPSVSEASNIHVYEEPKLTIERWEKNIRQECQHRLVTPAQIHAQQDQYILCFSFYDINDLPTLRPHRGSLYLYSSHEAFDEEIQMDFRRLRAWVEYFSMRHAGLPLEELHWEVPQGERGLHASGHADGQSLVELINEIRPVILIPIHTEERGIKYFQQKVRGAGISIVVPKYGVPISLGS
ncbi:MAG: exonuclease [Chloroflexi bacterium]|nr:exonuclease [Chloroflexota bacterium]MCL5076152.1 exonuclease [Chloroflexota bacterium]